MRCAGILLLLLTAVAHAQLGESTSFREVEFDKLSQSDPSALGAQALAIRPEAWKHGETDHFIYHFVHSYVVTPVSVEAEFHYRVVAKELERDALTSETKAHIYVFEQPEDWREFQTYGHLEPWTGGIQSMGSIFVQRNPKYRFSSNALGHEIVHLVLYRLYPEGIPCWLNEGLAQYISKAAHASYQRARGYIAKPHSEAIAPEELIPMAQLISATLPPNDKVVTFYNESERLMRFLATTDKASFLKLLDAVGHHQPFELALTRIYSGKFLSTAMLETSFREYATNEYGTTLEQTSD